MRYEILGPLRVINGHKEVSLTANKLEIFLATLIIRAGQVVPIEQLLTELWGDEPPRRADASLYVYVSHLRKALSRIAVGDTPIVTRAPGYLLRLDGGTTDFHIFEAKIHEGRVYLEAGAAGEAAVALKTAMSLWRGAPLGGLRGGPILDAFTAWLEESRLQCLELLVEANLELEEYHESVRMLLSLVREYPLRETFYTQLMRALYSSGRQADALNVYQRARYVINSELGLEPCREMRDLHQAILVGTTL